MRESGFRYGGIHGEIMGFRGQPGQQLVVADQHPAGSSGAGVRQGTVIPAASGAESRAVEGDGESLIIRARSAS